MRKAAQAAKNRPVRIIAATRLPVSPERAAYELEMTVNRPARRTELLTCHGLRFSNTFIILSLCLNENRTKDGDVVFLKTVDELREHCNGCPAGQNYNADRGKMIEGFFPYGARSTGS